MRKLLIALLFVFIGVPVFSQVLMSKTDQGFLFTENGDSVLLYRSKQVSIDGKYERTNYIHPLWAPDGTVITEDFPADHLHHRGIFWAWHQLNIAGTNIGDGWELKDFQQKITDIEFRSIAGGKALLIALVDWKSPRWNQGLPFLTEKTEIVIHPQTNNVRRIDFTIRLMAKTEDLSIGGSTDEKGYSGFSTRVKLPDDIVFKGPNGIVEPKVTAVESPGYIDVSGGMLKNGKQGGVVIVDSHENPGYPQQWILRNKKSMQNAAWPGNRLVPVSTKEPLVLKYTLLVYSGKLSDKTIGKMIQ